VAGPWSRNVSKNIQQEKKERQERTGRGRWGRSNIKLARQTGTVNAKLKRVAPKNVRTATRKVKECALCRETGGGGGVTVAGIQSQTNNEEEERKTPQHSQTKPGKKKKTRAPGRKEKRELKNEGKL